MAVARSKVLRDDPDVSSRLARLHLTKSNVLSVRNVAVAAAADATPFHPANAPGTLSYQHGTFALRNEHAETGWEADRPNGVEAIKNESIKTRVVFANVDVACNDLHQPKARSDKGAGAERLCAGNGLFEDLPHYANSDGGTNDGWTTFYLMVAPNGAVELSRATIKNNKFEEFPERIYLSDGSDLDTEPKRLEDDVPADEFDPQVARK